MSSPKMKKKFVSKFQDNWIEKDEFIEWLIKQGLNQFYITTRQRLYIKC